MDWIVLPVKINALVKSLSSTALPYTSPWQCNNVCKNNLKATFYLQPLLSPQMNGKKGVGEWEIISLHCGIMSQGSDPLASLTKTGEMRRTVCTWENVGGKEAKRNWWKYSMQIIKGRGEAVFSVAVVRFWALGWTGCLAPDGSPEWCAMPRSWMCLSGPGDVVYGFSAAQATLSFHMLRRGPGSSWHGKESLQIEVGQSWQESPSISPFLVLQREVPGDSCPYSPVASSMAATTRLLLRSCIQAKEMVEHSHFAVPLLPSATLAIASLYMPGKHEYYREHDLGLYL